MHRYNIYTNFREPNRWPFKDADGMMGTISVNGTIRYSNTEACLLAAEAGLGIACVPSFVAGAAIRGRKVQRLLETFESEPYGVYALYPHNRHLAAKVRVLVDFLVERYRGTPHWEEGW